VKKTYTKRRGYHHWLCLVCGQREGERIPDQADDRYQHNPANPWLGVCGGCNGGSPSARISLGNSSLRPQPSLTEETQIPTFGGIWGEFWQVAKRFERKAIAQDREDLRHSIILELAIAQQRNGDKPLSDPTLYRIASYVVADYWRILNQTPVKVCVLSGIAKKADYGKCTYQHKPNSCAKCSYRALRPIESLNTEVEDTEGGSTELIDTIADDSAIDLEAWVDARTWLLGCPKRLIQVAHKRAMGKPLEGKEQDYLDHWRKKSQKRLF